MRATLDREMRSLPLCVSSLALLAAACAPEVPGPQWFDDRGGGAGVPADPVFSTFATATAIAIEDLDGDGLLDVAYAIPRRLRVLRNRGNFAFEDVTGELGLPADGAGAIAFVDLDGDRDADFVAAGTGRLTIALRDGDVFVPTSALDAHGATLVDSPHLLPLDVDLDGLVDFYVCSHGGRDRLLRDIGDGTYEDLGPGLAIQDDDPSFCATWYDYDHDGDADLYVAVDTQIDDPGDRPEWSETLRSTRSDRLYRFDGVSDDGVPILIDVAPAAQLDVSRSSMGGLPFDVDDDGRLELFTSDVGRNHVLAAGDDGVIEHRTAELGLVHPFRDERECAGVDRPRDCILTSWGAAYLDADHDGRGDLVVVRGSVYEPRLEQPVGTWRGVEGGFERVPGVLPDMHARALIAADLDGDRDLDLMVGRVTEPVRFFAGAGAGAHVTALRLRGRTSTPDGLGAVVIARTSDGRARTFAHASGGSVQAHAPPITWIDPGSAELVEVEVRWPSGYVQRVAADGHPATLEIEEPPLVTLDRRVSFADGASEIAIEVRPHDDRGRPLASATVIIETTAGTLGETALEDGVHRATLTAPTSAATAVLRVRIDGRELRCRPRVVFR